jgi:hypothetical protein
MLYENRQLLSQITDFALVWKNITLAVTKMPKGAFATSYRY